MRKNVRIIDHSPHSSPISPPFWPFFFHSKRPPEDLLLLARFGDRARKYRRKLNNQTECPARRLTAWRGGSARVSPRHSSPPWNDVLVSISQPMPLMMRKRKKPKIALSLWTICLLISILALGWIILHPLTTSLFDSAELGSPTLSYLSPGSKQRKWKCNSGINCNFFSPYDWFFPWSFLYKVFVRWHFHYMVKKHLSTNKTPFIVLLPWYSLSSVLLALGK